MTHPLDQVRLDAFDKAGRLLQTLRTEQSPTEQALEREPFNPGQLRSFQMTLRETAAANR